ncbi:hypothetical protein CSW30_09050, partial [Thermus scotoductus]
GLLRGAFGLLAQGAFRAGQAVLFLGRALLLNPVGLVLGALAGLVYLFRQAWGASESFRKSVLGTLQAVRSAFAPVLAEFRGLGEALAGLFRPLGGAIQASLASAQAAWDRFGYALGYGIGFLFGLLEALVVRLAPIFADGLAGLIRILRGFVDVVVGLFTLDLDRARLGALRIWEGLRASLLYTYDHGDDRTSVNLGGCRIIEKNKLRFVDLACSRIIKNTNRSKLNEHTTVNNKLTSKNKTNKKTKTKDEST